ncbi:MAG: uroporphyrinogen-III synthase [Hydrogenothermaceae bacterium]|nr:uroporphyrinogen-III synthase [Hydrogenothermaceae bacterium]
MMKNVLITRDRNQFEEIKDLFIENGLNPISFPVIKFSSVEFYFDERDYDYLIFSSSNSVKFFFEKIDRLQKVKIIAVGEKTKEKLESLGYKDIITPQEYSAEGVLNFIKSNISQFECKKVGIVRALEGIDTLLNRKPPNVYVDVIPVYKTEFNIPSNVEEIRKMFEEGKIDFVIFSSPSTVKGFLRIFKPDVLKNCKVVVIGKTTLQEASKYGINVDMMPSKSTFADIVNLIKSA